MERSKICRWAMFWQVNAPRKTPNNLMDQAFWLCLDKKTKQCTKRKQQSGEQQD